MDEKESAAFRYELRSMPRVPISSVAPDAVVKVRGFVSTVGSPLAAPASGDPCAIYCVEWRELAPRADRWPLPWEEDAALFAPLPVQREVAGCDLILDDGTGRALVRVSRGRISLLGNWRLARAQDPERDIEHREMKVEQGALLTVVGQDTYEADSAAAPPAAARANSPYRTPQRRCVLAASEASPLYLVRELIVSLDAVG